MPPPLGLLLLSSAALACDAISLAFSSPLWTFPTTRSMLVEETVLRPTAAPPSAASESRASRQRSFAILPLVVLLPLPVPLKAPPFPPPLLLLLTGDHPPGDRRGPREPVGGFGAPVGSIAGEGKADE